MPGKVYSLCTHLIGMGMLFLKYNFLSPNHYGEIHLGLQIMHGKIFFFFNEKKCNHG